MSTPDDIRNVVVLGHKGTGKTALVEALLYVSKVTPKLGRSGDRASGLDDSPEERAHSATLEARPVTLRWNNKKITVVDTPGEASFVAEARLAMTACDAAILCVSAKDGVQTGTERALKWVREMNVPCLVVLTKMDDEHAKPDEATAALKQHLKTPIALMEVPEGVGPKFQGVIAVRSGKAYVGKPESPTAIGSVPIPPESKPRVDQARSRLVDDVAGTDDALTEKYLEAGDLSQEDLDAGAQHAITAGKLIPVYEVSCTMPSGIVALLDGIVDLLPSPSARVFESVKANDKRECKADGPLAAIVFKTHVDPHVGKISYLRVVSGTLKPDLNVICSESQQRDRIGQITQGTWKELKPIGEAIAGEVCAVAKLKSARTGETLSDEKKPFVAKLPPQPPALYSRTLVVEGKGVEEKAAATLQKICEEDPGLAFKHDAQSREMMLEGLGALHLDITLERLRRRASIDARLGPPRIPYRETIRGRAQHVEGKQKKQTGGHGQFGVCYIDVEPLPRGSGFEFEDAIVGGVIPRQFIPSVEKGIRKALERGVLAGYPLVDFKVRLVDGKYHAVDSSDAAFQVAGARAMRAALAQSQPALLEPIAKLEVTIPSDYLGDVIGDINARGGRVSGTDSQGTNAVVEAFIPLASTNDYEPKLTSITSGRGSFTIAFDHYDLCSPHTTDKVVKDSGFKVVEEED